MVSLNNTSSPLSGSLSSSSSPLSRSSSSSSFSLSSTSSPLSDSLNSSSSPLISRSSSSSFPSTSSPLIGTLLHIGEARPLVCQMGGFSRLKVKNLAQETQFLEPPPLSLDRDSQAVTLRSSSTSSLLPAVDPKEGKGEVVSTSLMTNKIASQLPFLPSAATRSRGGTILRKSLLTNNSSASTTQSYLPSSLPSVNVRTRENNPRSNFQKRDILMQQAYNFANACDFKSALDCIQEIIVIARSLDVSCISIDRLEIDMRLRQIGSLVRQLEYNLNESNIPALRVCIQEFLRKYPIKKHLVEHESIRRTLRCRTEFNCDYSEARLEVDLFQSIDRLEIDMRVRQIESLVRQLEHCPDVILIPKLKECIQEFLRKHLIKEHFNEYKLIIQILKCHIEFNCDYSEARLEVDLLQFIDRLEMDIRVRQIENLMRQLERNPIESDIPKLKVCIQEFLEKYSVETHPHKREFIVKILKCRIELVFNRYHNNLIDTEVLQAEKDLLKLGELCGPIISNPFILKYQGILYYFQNKTDIALTNLNRALELTPNDPLVLTRLGLVCAKKAEEANPAEQLAIYKEALQHFEKVLEINKNKLHPNNLLALKGSFFVCYRLGKMQLALTYAGLALSCAPQDKEASHYYDSVFKCIYG